MRTDESMKLPKGKTCADCIHMKRCTMNFGSNAKNVDCDWSPSRFSEKPSGKFGIVELIGRQQMAGRISDQEIDGIQFVRVDVPQTKTHKAFICFFGIESIYGITPITELHAENINHAREIGRFPLTEEEKKVDADLAAREGDLIEKRGGTVLITAGGRVQ
ncbi:MAG: hypothetical protein C0401_06515 [Anaerolinea sp.]|nr:hypothetical protein [Anaerolinea sp.]